jgi:adenylate cyclase
MRKNRAQLLVVLSLGALYVAAIIGYWQTDKKIWNKWDYQLLDLYYQKAVKDGLGPEKSNQIIYLDITDETYEAIDKNISEREYLSNVNFVLADLGVESIAYDIVFTRPAPSEINEKFIESLDNMNGVYLPSSFYPEPEHNPVPFQWKSGVSYEKLREIINNSPVEKGNSNPLYALGAKFENPSLSVANIKYGHINAPSDIDGVLRHQAMVIKLDSGLVPALTLAMFLDYQQIPFSKVIVHWGKEIRIPAKEGPFLKKDVVIPIDETGRTFIPFPDYWNKDFTHMPIHQVIPNYENEEIRDNLLELFEGAFIFIGNFTSSSSDSETNSLEKDVWKISLHTALMNAFLMDSFYRNWNQSEIIWIFIILSGVLILSALPKNDMIYYVSSFTVFCFIVWWPWQQITNKLMFPIASIGGSLIVLFAGLLAIKHVLGGKDKRFIQQAFSRYVPSKVVNQIIAYPDSLKLGGEVRVATVLFSDIAGFTTISEKMSPAKLVGLLNDYLTEMTNIIFEQGGIIDKYHGDAIMAEFGVPIFLEDHADRAVVTGLLMQSRLIELRKKWAEKGLPELSCRVGINSGSMTVGNMGSNQAFDYTVIGDSVNLASRLEGANKLYGTYLMVSEFTHELLTPNRFRTRVLDVIKVKGKLQPVKVYEVYGEASKDVDSEKVKYYEQYQKGFDAYLNRNFSSAMDYFQESRSLVPDDLAANEMIRRINSLDINNLSEDWDGSIALTEK